MNSNLFIYLASCVSSSNLMLIAQGTALMYRALMGGNELRGNG